METSAASLSLLLPPPPPSNAAAGRTGSGTGAGTVAGADGERAGGAVSNGVPGAVMPRFASLAWTVPFARGNLTAVAYGPDGSVVGSKTVLSAGKGVALRAYVADPYLHGRNASEITADGQVRTQFFGGLFWFTRLGCAFVHVQTQPCSVQPCGVCPGCPRNTTFVCPPCSHLASASLTTDN